ncbi:MAG: hypothetical protein PVJ55_01435 [Anaerolineae bacterium]|jgi:hypothetical protein
MAKRRGRRGTTKSGNHQQAETGAAFQWIPLWGWAILFLVPLILSEFMFWKVDKIVSMILFPIAWIGFWYVMMGRAGWPMLKTRGRNEETDSDDGG